jgi:hypothetical protein
MTAIAYVRTPKGFVVGSDGRGENKLGETTHENLRKLIPLKGPCVDLICGWAGADKVPSENEPFRLSKETKRIGRALSGVQLGERYVEEFCKKLRQSFATQISEYYKEYRTCALFLGYADNHLQHWEWNLGKDSEPQEVRPLPFELQYRVFSGCLRCLGGLPTAYTLEAGIKGIRDYLKCCRQCCTKYGGRTQILSVPCPPGANASRSSGRPRN